MNQWRAMKSATITPSMNVLASRDALLSVTVEIPNDSQRMYTIINDSYSPVEEDSHYFITLTAISNGTKSTPSETVSVTTGDAGSYLKGFNSSY